MTDSPQPDKRQKLIKTIVGVVAGLAAYFLVQQFFAPPSFDKAMMQAASELNESCPIMVDQNTRLDNAIALPGNVFQYNYTLVNLSLADIDVPTLTSSLTPHLTNNVSTNPDLKSYRDHQVTMSYAYKDRHGKFVTKVSVTPQDYQQ